MILRELAENEQFSSKADGYGPSINRKLWVESSLPLPSDNAEPQPRRARPAKPGPHELYSSHFRFRHLDMKAL